jgi:alcohol dehydrogenase (cytochrome c)
MTMNNAARNGRRFRLAALMLIASVGATVAIAARYPEVTSARLASASTDKGWLMFRRDYASDDYAPFGQINRHNVTGLKLLWDYRTGLDEGHEATPVVNGRYMFITTPKDHLIALDAVTGKVLWTYAHDLSHVGLKTVCCDVVNRGVALYGNDVYLATLDNYVIAFDGPTGRIVWKRQLEPADTGYAMTLAPLVVKGMVVVGVSGGEYGIRGFVEALDATTGQERWRTFTIPSVAQAGGDTWPSGKYKTGGGGAWLTGSYDAATDTLLWGVGNPGPWLATVRPGKNLYTDSVMAMDPGTGRVKWYFQYTPNDSWDYDGVNETVVTNLEHHGKRYKAIVTASRNGWFYAINRTNGKLIYAVRFTGATSVAGMRGGEPYTDEALRPTVDRQVFTCPSFLGGKNWWPISVDPRTHMAYVPTIHTCMTIKGAPGFYKPGLAYLEETFKVVHDTGDPNWGALQAIDLNTGRQVWNHETALPWDAGATSTAGGLVFSGSADGHLYAFDARTGGVLWRSPRLSSGIIAAPSTYLVAGKQYVAILAGWGGATPLWGGDMASAVKGIPLGGHLYVFSLR